MGTSAIQLFVGRLFWTVGRSHAEQVPPMLRLEDSRLALVVDGVVAGGGKFVESDVGALPPGGEEGVSVVAVVPLLWLWLSRRPHRVSVVVITMGIGNGSAVVCVVREAL